MSKGSTFTLRPITPFTATSPLRVHLATVTGSLRLDQRRARDVPARSAFDRGGSCENTYVVCRFLAAAGRGRPALRWQ